MPSHEMWYLAPEALSGHVSNPTDIWQLCSCFYKPLKGFAAFYATEKLNILKIFQRKENYVGYKDLTLEEINDQAFCDVINQVLCNRMSDRPQIDVIINTLEYSMQSKAEHEIFSNNDEVPTLLNPQLKMVMESTVTIQDSEIQDSEKMESIRISNPKAEKNTIEAKIQNIEQSNGIDIQQPLLENVEECEQTDEENSNQKVNDSNM